VRAEIALVAQCLQRAFDQRFATAEHGGMAFIERGEADIGIAAPGRCGQRVFPRSIQSGHGADERVAGAALRGQVARCPGAVSQQRSQLGDGLFHCRIGELPAAPGFIQQRLLRESRVRRARHDDQQQHQLFLGFPGLPIDFDGQRCRLDDDVGTHTEWRQGRQGVA
jgi:hypothetical protein